MTDLYTNQPLRDAFVRTEPPSRSINTDNDGTFRIADVPASEYEARAEILGYTIRTVRVTVTSDVTVTANFAMDSLAAEQGNCVPYNPVPSSSAQGQSTTTTLRWECDAPTAARPPTLSLGTSNPPTAKVASGLTTLAYNASALQPGTTCYWRVLARSASGEPGNALGVNNGGISSDNDNLTVPYDPSLALSSGSFTIEAWCKATTVFNTGCLNYYWLIDRSVPGNSGMDYLLGISDGKFRFIARSITNDLTGTLRPTAGQ